MAAQAEGKQTNGIRVLLEGLMDIDDGKSGFLGR
jgi:hypothetical protein